MHITYRPKGVCSQLFEIDVENGIIEKVEVKGGCSGNLQGFAAACGDEGRGCRRQIGGYTLRIQGNIVPRSVIQSTEKLHIKTAI